MEKPLIQKSYMLQKFPGKGGWTYAMIPEIPMDKKSPFGWVKVKGSIDDYEFDDYRLMPMGNGHLFLPIRAAIRKKIGKQAGDYVKVTLFRDESSLLIPDDFLSCLKDEPKAHDSFFKLSESKQREYVRWIQAAKKDETKAERMVDLISQLISGKPQSK